MANDGGTFVITASIRHPSASRLAGVMTLPMRKCAAVARAWSQQINIMSGNDGVRYCQRFSYVFLKFLLFFYSIVFWVSWSVSAGQPAAGRGSLCGHVLWAGDGGHVGFFHANKTFGLRQTRRVGRGEEFAPSPTVRIGISTHTGVSTCGGVKSQCSYRGHTLYRPPLGGWTCSIRTEHAAD